MRAVKRKIAKATAKKTEKIKVNMDVIAPKSKKVQLIEGTHGETMDYDLFEQLRYNRGFKTSIDPKIIAKFELDIENGEFIDEGIDALVNKHGKIIDKHHHAYLRRERGLSIRYYVTTTPKCNVTDPIKISNIVSHFNSHSSKHTKQNVFNQAVAEKRPLALLITKLKRKISAETGVRVNKISNSWVYSLLNANHKLFNASSILDKLETFSNVECSKYSCKKQFKNDLNIFIRLVKALNDTSAKSRFYKVSGLILKLHWTQQLFDVNKLITNIEKHGFNADAYNTNPPIQNEIESIYNWGVSKNYVKLYKNDKEYSNVTKSYLHTY